MNSTCRTRSREERKGRGRQWNVFRRIEAQIRGGGGLNDLSLFCVSFFSLFVLLCFTLSVQGVKNWIRIIMPRCPSVWKAWQLGKLFFMSEKCGYQRDIHFIRTRYAYNKAWVKYVWSPKVSNCAGLYRLEHNYIVRYKISQKLYCQIYKNISQLHVSALMAIFRLDTELDHTYVYNVPYYI